MSLTTVMLPAEIVDHIFSFLQSDPFTLRKCVECHPVLSKFAARHLYARITISDTGYNNPQIIPSSRLGNLLSRSPHITKYVRSLTIKLTPQMFFPGRSIQSLEADVTATTLQDRLPFLEKFCLASYRGTVWLGINKNIRAVFLAFLRLPTLKEVTIERIEEFPLSALDECQNITRLLLRGRFRYSNLEVRSPYPRLDFLSLQCCLPTIIPWIRSHTPRSLDFRVDDPVMFQKLLQVCSDTLTWLNVDLSHCLCCDTEYDLTVPGVTLLSTYPNNASFNLGPLSSLQKLGFHACSQFLGSGSRQRYYSPLPTIVQALLTLPSSCPLKTVNLHFNISVIRDCDLSEIDWSPLFSPSLFRIVHQIHLRIKATNERNFVVPPARVISSLTGNAQLMKMVKQQRQLVVIVEGFGDLSDVGI